MEINPADIVTNSCTCCYLTVAEADNFCQYCGFPLKGHEIVRELFLANRNNKLVRLESLEKKIRGSSNTLLTISALFAVSALFVFASKKEDQTEPYLTLAGFLLAIIFLLLGLWCRVKPVAAIITGIVLFGGIIVTNLFTEDLGMEKVSGPFVYLNKIVFTIFIIIYLSQGLQSALNAQKIKKELNIG